MLGYHGCDQDLADRVVAGAVVLTPSRNDYDWLGHGQYFWEDSPQRARQWAEEAAARKGSTVRRPGVLGAVIDLGNCLNLTEAEHLDTVVLAYERLKQLSLRSGLTLPANTGRDLKARRLDCAVFEAVHKSLESDGRPPFDTVRAYFQEGAPLYPTAGIRRLDHVQGLRPEHSHGARVLSAPLTSPRFNLRPTALRAPSGAKTLGRRVVSYDLFFFVRAENCTVDEINEYLAEHDADDDDGELSSEDVRIVEVDDEDDDENDEGEESGPGGMPMRFVEERFDHDEFARLLLKPYLKTTADPAEILDSVDEGDRDAVEKWLASSDAEMPEAAEILAESLFEYSMDDGMMPLMLGYNSGLTELIPRIVSMMDHPDLVKNRICVYDPQIGRVLTTADTGLEESVGEIVEGFENIMASLQEDGPGFTESLPEGSHDDVAAMESPQILARITDPSDGVVTDIVVGTFGELLLALEILDNCISIIADLDESPGEDAPKPSELAEWVESLEGDEEEDMEMPFDDMLAAGAAENGFDADVLEFPLGLRRLGTLLFVIGDPRGEEELFVGYLLFRYCMGALASVAPFWEAQGDFRATQAELAEKFLRTYCEACEEVFDSPKTMTCTVVRQG